MHYKFGTSWTNESDDLVGGLKAFLGSTSSYWNYGGTNDPTDPWDPKVHRYGGLYFAGDDYVQLPPNSSETGSLLFNYAHTVYLIVRSINVDTVLPADQYLLTKYSQDGLDLKYAIYMDINR